MTYPSNDGWPIFALVSIREEGTRNDPGEGRGMGIEVPVSMVGHEYQVADHLTRIDAPGQGRFVRFGSVGLSGSMLLDTETGAVVKLEEGADGVDPVSSSLSVFVGIVRAVIERFPFNESDEDDERWAAGRDVKEIVLAADPDAFVEGGFWETFVSDIKMGDYATETLLE